MICPVCNRDGAGSEGNRPGRDQQIVACPRCGTFYADRLLSTAISNAWNDRRYLITAAIRQRVDNGEPPEVSEETLPILASTVRAPVDLLEGVDRVLELLARRTERYKSRVEPRNDTEYPLVVVRGPEELNELVLFTEELGYYSIPDKRITLKGWQRVEELRRRRPSSPQAFVAMWFDPSMDSAWLHGFKPGIEDSRRFVALRIDKKEHTNKIDDEIITEIRRSGLVVADFTGDRGGVYFEAGFAQGLGIPVVWTCREDHFSSVHFDTRQYSHIVWKEPEDLRVALGNRISALG